MKEFLSQKGVNFQEKNVATDTQAREEMMQKSQSMAVPTIVVGDAVVVGFDKTKLEKILH